MVVDTSAVVAILLEETGSHNLVHALANSRQPYMSAVNVYETAIVLRRYHGTDAVELIWEFIARYGIEIVPFDEASAKAAAAAYDRYGKGIDPKARLNLADCVAYGLARALDLPLLYKGQDFAATDIGSCL